MLIHALNISVLAAIDELLASRTKRHGDASSFGHRSVLSLDSRKGHQQKAPSAKRSQISLPRRVQMPFLGARASVTQHELIWGYVGFRYAFENVGR